MHVTVDVHMTPIGTGSTSISDAVAAAESVLKRYPDLEVRLNPMSTTISGELERILAAVREMHEATFTKGAQRVSTTLRIDDRRDVPHRSLEDRVQSVQQKISV